jgi:hypothetical protein
VARRPAAREDGPADSARDPSPEAAAVPTDPSPIEVPDELRHLGELRQVFATTAGAVATSVVRALIPLALGGGLVAVAELWLVAGTWKYFVALGLGLLLALQGVRVLVRTMFRRNQKVLIFEKGLAVWRYGQMATFRWDQVDQVEALVAKAQGAPTSFLGFSFRGQSDDGELRTYADHPAGDPIPKLKVLWTTIEEAAGRGRAAAAIAAVAAGEEVTFQRTIWGKVVSTQIGVSLFGIRAKPRYDVSRFLDWSRVEQIALVATPTAAQEEGYTTGGIPHLEVRQTYRPDEPWVSELASELPGYQALIEAAEFARQRYAETAEQVDRDRFPAARAVIAAGEEFCLGTFGVCRTGFRHDTEVFSWGELGYLRFDKDELVAPAMENRTFAYGSLTLADRWLLQLVELTTHYDHDLSKDGKKDEDAPSAADPE